MRLPSILPIRLAWATTGLVALLIVSIAGCDDAGPPRYEGTFAGWETVKTSVPQPDDGDEGQVGGYETYGTYGDPPKYDITKTGRARIRLSSGVTVLADCPFVIKNDRQRVEVQQNSDGSWVVLGLE